MAYQGVEAIDPRDAFTVTARLGSESTQSAAASQAAMLLALRAGVLGVTQDTERWTVEGKREGFALPELKMLQRSRRMKVSEATQHLGISVRELQRDAEPQLKVEMLKIVHELYQKPSVECAASLFEAAMYSPHPLVAVAGAAGARETTRLRLHIRTILEHGAESEDRLTARLAQAALWAISPKDPAVRKRVIAQPKTKKRNRKSRTAAITHGTFAANSAWYQPGGNFYAALDTNRPDLHVHDRSFKWTGAYSHPARRADAVLLNQWLSNEGLSSPDFFTHSHGGTVANLATKQGARFDRLVLMGWPVHQRWFPDFAKVKRIIDIRVRFDLVILLDRGAQRFRTNLFNVEEHRHGWFDHSSTHESGYWDRYGLWGVV